MSLIKNGFTTAPDSWTNISQYVISQLYGVAGELFYVCPQTTDADITYVANKLDGNNQPIQPTVGTAPHLDTAWSIAGGGADVLGTVLTGLSPAAGNIAATDSILLAFNKTQGNFNNVNKSFVNIVPTAGYSLALSTSPSNLVLNTNTSIVKSTDITVASNNITLPAGHVYVAEFGMQSDTFSATSVLVKTQWNVNGTLNPNLAISSAGSGTVGSQSVSKCIIDTTAGGFVVNVITQTLTGTASLTFGNGIWINIYSIK